MKLYQRDEATGYPVGSDTPQRESWGKIPENNGGEFLVPVGAIGAYGVPDAVLGWNWSATFGRWSALIVWGGKKVWSFPKHGV